MNLRPMPVVPLAALLALLSIPVTGAPEPKPVPAGGSYVSFGGVGLKAIRPPGFEKAEGFYGFQQKETGASVMLIRIPGPFAEATRGFTAEQLKARGSTLVSRTDAQIDGRPGLLLYLTQSAYGIKFGKWVAAFGDPAQTYMATATFPLAREKTLSPLLKKAVLGVRVDTLAADPAADVPFTLVSSKLKLTPGIGKMLAFTRDGVLLEKSPEDPIFVAAPSVSSVPILDPKEFSLARLRQTVKTTIEKVVSHEPVKIDGLSGFESIADAKGETSGTPVLLYQVMLFDSGPYFLMQGIVGAGLRDEYLPEFKAMARSFRRKSPAPAR
jgi:hypothetical protein